MMNETAKKPCISYIQSVVNGICQEHFDIDTPMLATGEMTMTEHVKTQLQG